MNTGTFPFKKLDMAAICNFLEDVNQFADMANKQKEAADSIKDPVLPAYFLSNGDYDDYQRVCNNTFELRKNAIDRYENASKLHNEARCRVLELIPEKAVWFKIGAPHHVWIAKTSNNLMDKDGNNLQVLSCNEYPKGASLPKLTTL